MQNDKGHTHANKHTHKDTRTQCTHTHTHTQSVSFTHSLSISNLIPAPADMEKPRTFHCGQCGKTISQSGELRTHQCVHIEVKLFCCEDVKRALPHTLWRAINIFTQEKQALCTPPTLFPATSAVLESTSHNTTWRPQFCRQGRPHNVLPWWSHHGTPYNILPGSAIIKSLSSLPICKDVLLFEPRTTTSSGTLILNSDVTVAFVLETFVPPTPATSWGTGNSGNMRRTLAQWKGSIRDMYLTTLVASNGKAITKEFGLCRYGSATSCQCTLNGKSIEKWLAEQRVAK